MRLDVALSTATAPRGQQVVRRGAGAEVLVTAAHNFEGATAFGIGSDEASNDTSTLRWLPDCDIHFVGGEAKDAYDVAIVRRRLVQRRGSGWKRSRSRWSDSASSTFRTGGRARLPGGAGGVEGTTLARPPARPDLHDPRCSMAGLSRGL